MNIILTILNALLLTIGQMLFKLGIGKLGKFNLSLSGVISIIHNLYIMSGIVLYGCTTFLWLYILSKSEFNKVYPIQSLAFVFAMIMSIVILKENVPINRWIGVFVICIGTYVSCYK